MSKNKDLCVDRKGMSKIHTHIVMSLVILGSVHDLSHCLHISVVQSQSVCAGVHCRTSIVLNDDGNKDFGKCHKKHKLYPQHKEMLKRRNENMK